jgi:hypothetical protein
MSGSSKGCGTKSSTPCRDQAAYALGREILRGRQDRCSAAALLDDLSELAKLPLVVGVDVDQQHVYPLEAGDELPVDALQGADPGLGAHVVDRAEHGADPVAELGRPRHRQDVQGTGTNHDLLRGKRQLASGPGIIRRSRR